MFHPISIPMIGSGNRNNQREIIPGTAHLPNLELRPLVTSLIREHLR
jgi:hypothetical protein